MKLLAENDIFGLPFAEEHGGTGTGTLMLQMAVEEIAHADASCALILMVQDSERSRSRFRHRGARSSGSCQSARAANGFGVRAVRGGGRLQCRCDAGRRQ